jgi:hypothetical protein
MIQLTDSVISRVRDDLSTVEWNVFLAWVRENAPLPRRVEGNGEVFAFDAGCQYGMAVTLRAIETIDFPDRKAGNAKPPQRPRLPDTRNPDVLRGGLEKFNQD